MSDPKAARLAAIRAANAQKQAAAATPPPPATGETIQLPAAVAAPAVESPPTPVGVPYGVLAMAGVIGAFLAAFAIPSLLPGISASLAGSEPKAYWYLSRSTALVAYALLWLSMVMGLMMTSKMSRIWPGGPVAFALHQQASLLGLSFGLFHALILLGDRYANYTLAQILVPFASGGADRLWVGLGQVSLYLMGIVGLSFYVRPLIGRQGWRVLHIISFVIFGLVFFHGVQSGTDTSSLWAQGLYWLSGGSVLYLTLYRVFNSLNRPVSPARPTAREPLAEA
ncbi:MAG: hypothetical protein HGA65_04655 [Oscillochloris sp.]|nr:hypothetical protein [Oscillochloris sp.]